MSVCDRERERVTWESECVSAREMERDEER